MTDPVEKLLPKERKLPPVEGEWGGVSQLPAEAGEIMADLERLELLIRLLQGGPAGSPHWRACMSFLHSIQLARRAELAIVVLSHHNIEVPDSSLEGGEGS